MRSSLFSAVTVLSSLASALNSIIVREQEFVDSVTGYRFEVVGVDYQPGGSSAFTYTGPDPLSDANVNACIRDASIMQGLGVNTIRVYNLNPYISHNMCASIFNQAGIYMILDVNSPLGGQSINQASPAASYDTAYLNRTFAVLEAFRGYPNTLGFFSANELINDDPTAAIDPPYIRAVTRDLKQYMAARGGRQIPIGYSAADVRDILIDTSNYVQCSIGGSTTAQNILSGRSDFFALNSYSWCGDATFTSSTYNQLAADYLNTTIPIFFSEFGCNLVMPRTFTDIPVLYGDMMTTWSGGLVYQWTQEGNDYGLVNVNSDGSVSLTADFANLKAQYAKINLSITQSFNASAGALTAPVCSSSLFTGTAFNASFSIPAAPAGAAAIIKNGVVGATLGTLVAVTKTSIAYAVTPISGAVTSSVSFSSVTNANIPSGASGKPTATAAVSGVVSAAPSAAASATTGKSTATGTSSSASSTATKASAAGEQMYGSAGVGGENAAFGFVVATVLLYLMG